MMLRSCHRKSFLSQLGKIIVGSNFTVIHAVKNETYLNGIILNSSFSVNIHAQEGFRTERDEIEEMDSK